MDDVDGLGGAGVTPRNITEGGLSWIASVPVEVDACAGICALFPTSFRALFCGGGGSSLVLLVGCTGWDVDEIGWDVDEIGVKAEHVAGYTWEDNASRLEI